jgi:purine-nucleoside phosphorylase
MTVLDDISQSVPKIREWLNGLQPQLCVVLGSGLSAVLEQIEGLSSLPYSEIPDFIDTGVAGHAGFLHCGQLSNVPVLVFQGRFHCYEGYSAWQVTAPVRLAAALGCEKVLLTNAAGGIDPAMQPGDFMLVTDHLNMVGQNPLAGSPELDFVDLSSLYRHDIYGHLKQQLQADGIILHSGVLAWMLGPSYETPAEIRMLQNLGAAAVSMSTIPEAIMARRLGLDVVAISYLSNLAAGKSAKCLAHQDVLASGEQAGLATKKLSALLIDLWFN